MDTAAQIVCQMLETQYDIDDPLDRNDPAFYPAGFEAIRNDGSGDRRVFELSLRDSNSEAAVYSMRVYWIDDYSRLDRELFTRFWSRVPAANVDTWLEKEMEKWRAGGWMVRVLD